MEEVETSLFQTRKAHRIEQMVARWLRRSRDSSARAKVAAADGPAGIPIQTITPVKHTVKIDKDALLQDYGFHISESLPLTVVAVTAGGSAHGKLFPGDQILQMNDEPAESLSCERAVNILREAEDPLSITVVRCTSGNYRRPYQTLCKNEGILPYPQDPALPIWNPIFKRKMNLVDSDLFLGVPKSSFLTEEKRARLKTNPVKVHFAEEVLVSGHSQGNSLLCMPNVLKLYLENGQTKAFKFEANTTVKDIILTVKEKLSIRSMEYFALALEEQYNISRLHLLHEEELIQQVVEREESHDYRCLFRVCFVPKDPLDLLKEDPVAFEYLYLQSCSDVLQERFAVEMKCSSALRLAALHIQERIYACAQPQKISLKYIEKDWGIENFISPTLLRNMKGKDIKKAISFHMKRNQNLLEPRQKQLISAAQLRLNYLQILGELKTYGGKIFNATLMLQDRESYIALLVGAKYGISQIISSKLNIMSTLAEFANISRVELTEESEKVSMVKVYLQDVKVLTLLLESNSAKDLACLIAGYYRLFVDPDTSIFLWPGNKQQVHRVSAEEGYESRACSDSEESSEVDCVLEPLSDGHVLKLGPCRPLVKEEQPPGDSPMPEMARRGPSTSGASSMTDSAESEASDSANTESRGCRTSGSSESMDALEEDDLDTCSSSRSGFFHSNSPGFPETLGSSSQEERSRIETNGFLCLLDLAQRANHPCQKTEFSESPTPETFSWGPEPSAVRLDPRLYEGSRTDYYSLCSSVSLASHLSNSSESTASRQGRGLPAWGQKGWTEAQPSSALEALAPHLPLAFEDGSSDEEYYDAADKLTPPDTLSGPRAVSAAEPSATNSQNKVSTCTLEDGLNPGPDGREPSRRGGVKKYAKTLRKRRSFLQTDYTCQVSFPLVPSASLESVDDVCYYNREPYLALGAPSPTVSSLQDMHSEPGLLETKALGLLGPLRKPKSKNPASRVMEMEPETMETKSVIDSRVSSISAIRLCIDPNHKESSGDAPLTATVASSPASTPHCSNPGSSGPDNSRAEPSQTLSPFQHSDGSAPKELTLELGDSTSSLSSTDPNPDRGCQAISPGPHNASQADTLELGGVQFETRSGSLFTNPMQETAPKCTEPLLSPPLRPRSGEYGIYSEEKMASFPSEEEQQGQLSLVHDGEVTNKNGTDLFHDESWKDSGDSRGDLSNAVLQTGVIAPAGAIIASLSLKSPVTGTEQILPHSPTDPKGQSRETPSQTCQAQEQKLLEELDLDPDFLFGDQTIPSAFPLEEVKAEPLNHMIGKDTASRDTTQQICFNPGPSLPKPLACPQKEPHLEGSNHCSLSESKGKSPSICLPAEKSFLCFAPESHPKVSAGLRMATSLGFVGANETVAPRIGMEQCSCQFSYATCFRGLQPETEEEDRDLEAHPTAPLTSPPSAGSRLALPWRPARTHSCSAEPLPRKSHIWPEYCSRALRQLKAAPASTPEGFIQLRESLLELQDILEASWGNGNKHPPEKCTWHFSESRSRLCMGSQKLLSSCQHVIRMDQSPEEMQGAVRDTFQHLVQLAGLCFQFTDCSRCSSRHREAAGNLRDVVYAYHQFVEAAKLTCERGYHDLSVKLLARRCTALTAAVFCLTQKFRASAAL
ncbi:FERM and PDZ domain-containing protein 1 isoform X1 [Canis lupus dingo]|uniref:FERM and PDZ domain-containing protein 1 isoform X1 n=2 Tax=Canis lupus dingo TaxID=286419 RepID=UPI000DC67194|nr:FERM and PDZ domain-containing protein 1 isoform X1 [Canis lupus dingo]XP_025288014.1 FERM and PDZ domain-containing protein 1 isoform X1 [Canis lupus dingo]XP_025288015.1 FERM and PDZ domain-containing protein 1 isoform X1 [Canis lupus dingo]XP_035552842.1 FERM and PDZ domain-containing protein 1 isoform X1 [Canis lupus dingo]XP_038538114.1 FERM and PDZ domain-containing protein 1 isoform X1 [Canis lupus familiaris]XP_038538115.1 FERM and PDZ domain-containing protein 1 isoform X1 [Canis l